MARVFGPGTVLDEIAEFLRGHETRGQEQLLRELPRKAIGGRSADC